MILTLITWFFIIIAIAHIVVQLVGYYALLKTPIQKEPLQPDEHLPFISLLLAVRNEEKNLPRCLSTLVKLDYPKDKLEILIGNDCSEDNTGNIAESFAKQHSHIQVFHLDGSEYEQTKGKARVLAFLANQAKGKYFFITDADIEMNPAWMKGLLAAFDEKTAIVSGITVSESGGFFQNLLSLDWLYFMSLNNSFSNIGTNVTAVGNNMAITAEAYRRSGGYENLPFSITEDYKLFKIVHALGYKIRNPINPQTVLSCDPIPTFYDWLHQRKRWMRGGMELPFIWKSLMLVLAIYYIAMIWIAFTNPPLWLAIWFAKFILQSLQLMTTSRLVGQKSPSLLNMLLYDLYLYIAIPIMAIFYLTPTKIEWKGRKY
ncbi:MAG: glycosyltransferase [Bacteroidia bacterium]|nr:glycosyltransferase [Bacteroidia bacterium]